MASAETLDDCELCEEVHLAATSATGMTGNGGPRRPFSRLIKRTSVLDVIAGLGGILPGYVLLVPRRHVRSTGELDRLELAHVYQVARTMARRIRQTFGCSVVAVEHGSSGMSGRPGGACISHAHVHLFPITGDAGPQQFLPAGSRVTTGLTGLRLAAIQARNYYYFSDLESDTGHLALDPQLPSQHARRVWANLAGSAEEWDWGSAPNYENAIVTTVHLRQDELPDLSSRDSTDSPLRETLAAYSAGAELYATRTASFPVESTLPAEIEQLVRSSRGLVVDAGSASGRDAAHFARFGRDVVALDACLELLRLVPPDPRIRPTVGDVRRIPLQDGSVGAVWCSAVLLHLPLDAVAAALREFCRVLSHGGQAQVSVKEGNGHITSPMPGAGSLRRHFYFYEADDLAELAQRARLEVKETWAEDEVDVAGTVQRWVKLLLRKP